MFAHFLPTAYVVFQGYVFTGVCMCTWGCNLGDASQGCVSRGYIQGLHPGVHPGGLHAGGASTGCIQGVASRECILDATTCMVCTPKPGDATPQTRGHTLKPVDAPPPPPNKGMHLQPGNAPLTRRQTVNRRSVSILLECILAIYADMQKVCRCM